jgi:hypothetical protein
MHSPPTAASLSLSLDQLLGVEMDKREATSDWRVRPLSAEQLSYAANDVKHMLSLREMLIAEMVQAGRRDWFDEEMRGLLADTAAPDMADKERWRAVRRARKLRDSPTGIAVLRGVAAWREATARSVNVAPSLIFSDDACVQLAVAQPRTLTDLQAMRSVRGSTVRYVVTNLSNWFDLSHWSVRRHTHTRARAARARTHAHTHTHTSFCALCTVRRYYGRALLRAIDEAVSTETDGSAPAIEPPTEWLSNDPSQRASVEAATAATAARHRLFAVLYERSYVVNHPSRGTFKVLISATPI